MNLSVEHAADITRHLGNGARMTEAVSIAGAAWSDFAADWVAGRAGHESGKASETATWYAEASAARSRHIATQRAKAQATAGTRESADLLAYVRELQAEAEPLADMTEAPNAVRLFNDPDPGVREAAARVLDAGDDLLRALVARDRTARAARGEVLA